MANLIAPEELHDLLECNYETGELTWKPRKRNRRWNSNVAGKPALTAKLKTGARIGKILGETYMASRVVWAMYHGVWPSLLTNKDGNKSNIAISNLLETNASELAKAARASRK